jgi:hypothetical protein
MCHSLSLVLGLAIVCVAAESSAVAADITAERSAAGVVVKIDGKLFTEYLTRSGSKPVLWPIIGPTGKPVTRDYPFLDHSGEAKDHIHQRSMWFTHGNVNGVNFWAEPQTAPPGSKLGTIRHLKFVEVSSGQPATIVTENAWLGPKNVKICEDRRTLHFDTDGDARWIDFDVTVKATEGPLTFGDDKEGVFGIRTAHCMTVDAKRGGQIINSEGRRDNDAWGRTASWVDYHGPIDGKTVGIAVLNHPTSFRYPTYWHVRGYGLFAANPFGLHEFTAGKIASGAYTVPSGQSVTFRYRVFLHCGNEKEGRVAEAFSAYSKGENR